MTIDTAEKLKRIIIVVCIVAFMGIGFAIARMFSPNKVVVNVPASSIYQSAIDTLIADRKRRMGYEAVLESEFKVELKAEADLHKKTKHAYEQIKIFTDSTRIKWRDSVRAAHGL